MKRALVFRHLFFEDLGSLEEILPGLGYDFEYIDIPALSAAAIATIDPLAAELLLVLGGPLSVNDRSDYPWLEPELKHISSRMGARLSTVGICLGAQLIALAAGSRVYPGETKEIGWSHLKCSAEGRETGLGVFEEGGARVLHWHGETFDLPSGASLLASNENYPNQAFAIGDRILGLQFHIEARYPGLENWFVGHCTELNQAPAVDIPALRTDSMANAPASRRAAGEFFASWIARAEKAQG